MWTLFGFAIVLASAFGFGYARGSQDGFSKAVEQLERIAEHVIKRQA